MGMAGGRKWALSCPRTQLAGLPASLPFRGVFPPPRPSRGGDVDTSVPRVYPKFKGVSLPQLRMNFCWEGHTSSLFTYVWDLRQKGLGKRRNWLDEFTFLYCRQKEF